MKNKPAILVVDDQFQNVELLEAYLAPQGYEIVKASSGAEALEKISVNSIDLILLDIMMPHMSGLEVLEKLRANEKTRRVPVVMVTVLKETEDKIKALEAGCDDFISKPVDKIELLARVKAMLKISDYLGQLEEKEKFKAVVDKISDGIAVCGPDYIIKDSNVPMLNYLNIKDSPHVHMLDALFRNYTVSIDKEWLLDTAIAHKEFDMVRRDVETEESLHLEVHVDVIKNSAGKLLSVVFIFRDVTAARREESLTQESLALLSHQLSAPLGVISGNLSLLREGAYGPLNDEQKKAIDAVSKQSDLLVSMVEKRLGLSIVCG